MLDNLMRTSAVSAPVPDNQFEILLIGGGAAGITTAAMLPPKVKGRIAIVDPATTHAYQPGWTLVGGGVFTLDETIKSEASLIPKGVDWIQQAAAAFDPDNNIVTLADGRARGYRFLIVCPGLQLDWSKIEGLTDTLGKNGVCSNYRGDLAAYTWSCIKGFSSGKMIFTQPPMPIKCPGAPQKIAYLAADHLRLTNKRAAADIAFCTALPTLFGVGPVVVRNLIAAMKSETGTASYDGYGAWPLTTDYGKIVLAAFTYGGKVTPSFPLDPRVPRYLSWVLKKNVLPFLYWSVMLKGVDLDIGHRERNFADAA